MPEKILLQGKEIAERNRQLCLDLIRDHSLTPHLVVLVIEPNEAVKYYVDNIRKQARKFQVRVNVKQYSAKEITENDFLQEINSLNDDPGVHGIMVQKPLPANFDVGRIEWSISPLKDVDGIHPTNLGLLLQEKKCFVPCTAEAIAELIDFYQISVEKCHVVVLGRSNIVGKPIANLLLSKAPNRNATVTVCHSKTFNLQQFTQIADILISAVGIPYLIKPEMIKDNLVIIDAGINEVKNTQGLSCFVGDVDYNLCYPKCSAITPVPGGVGVVTTSVLFKHVVQSCNSLFSIR